MGFFSKAFGAVAVVTIGMIAAGSFQDYSGRAEEAKAAAENAARADESRRKEALRLAQMTPEERAAEETALAAAKQAEDKRAAQQKLDQLREKYGWRTETAVDQVSGKEHTTVTARSLTSISLGFPYQGEQSAYLAARKHPRFGNEVFIFIERGQLHCEYRSCSISVRFDDAPVKRWAVTEPSDNSSTVWFINDKARFLAELAKSQRTFVELQFFQQGLKTVEFLTEGFKRP